MASTRDRKAAAVAPTRIARVAARRVFHKPGERKQRVTLMIGVPQRVPGSDWGCLVQITGLDTSWNRPRFIHGIDGLQALYLAIQCAGAVLETCGCRLEWLGQTHDLDLPRFVPRLPTKSDRERLERLIEREMARAYAAAERRANGKARKAARHPTSG